LTDARAVLNTVACGDTEDTNHYDILYSTLNDGGRGQGAVPTRV
jgi:hypothetical protein